MDSVVMGTGSEGQDGCDQHHAEENPAPETSSEPDCNLEEEVEFLEEPEESDLRNEDPDGKCFNCSYCGRKFARRQTLEQHERIHTGEKPFRCSECSKCFRQRSALRVHRKGHTGDKAFECFVCFKRFYRSGDLKAHLGIHTGVREYICPVCSKGFGRPSDLKRHMQTHKADPVIVDVDKSPHECSQCGKKFTRRSQVEIHQRVHTGEKPYKCSQCGESFRWRQNFKAHQRNSTCEKPYHCSDCDRRFTCLPALEKHHVLLHSVLNKKTQCHQRSYKEDIRHECCQCGKSFNQAKDLVVHQRIHTGEKPFKCSECEKTFRQIGHLKEHQRVHSGEKPFQCSICHKCFPYSQSMKKHMRVIHAGVLIQNTQSHKEDIRHKCCQCGKSFNQAKDLVVHQRVHTGEKPFKCSECEKTFRQIGHLKEHQRVHSGEKPFQCSICHKCFPYSQSMKKHMRVIHAAQKANTSVIDFTLLDDVKEVKIGSPPSSPLSELPDDPESSDELIKHIKIEDSCLPLVEEGDMGFTPASVCSRVTSGVKVECSKEKSFSLKADVDSASSSPSSELPENPDKITPHVKSEQDFILEDGSTFFSPTSRLSKYPEVFDQLAHQVKSDDTYLTIMDDVVRVKIGSVGAL